MFLEVECKTKGELTVATVKGILSCKISPTIAEEITRQVPDADKRQKLVVDLRDVVKVVDHGTALIIEVITTCRSSDIRWVIKGAREVIEHLKAHKLLGYIKVSESVEEAKHDLRVTEAA